MNTWKCKCGNEIKNDGSYPTHCPACNELTDVYAAEKINQQGTFFQATGVNTKRVHGHKFEYYEAKTAWAKAANNILKGIAQENFMYRGK